MHKRSSVLRVPAIASVVLLFCAPCASAISTPDITSFSGITVGSTTVSVTGTGFQAGLNLTYISQSPVPPFGLVSTTLPAQNLTPTGFQITVPALGANNVGYGVQVTNPDGGTSLLFFSAVGLGVVTSFSGTDGEVDTINTTTVSQRVDTFSVEIKAHLPGGAVLFDQTYPVAFADPQVQAGVAQARALLTGAGAQSFQGPTQLSNSQSLVSSVTNTVPSGTTSQTIVGGHSYVGPLILNIGSLGLCQGYVLDGNNYATFTSCPNRQGFGGGGLLNDRFYVPAGVVDVDVTTLTLKTISQTATTTNTFLTTQVYDLVGLTTPVATTVPTLSEWGLGLMGGLLIATAALLGREKRIPCDPKN